MPLYEWDSVLLERRDGVGLADDSNCCCPGPKTCDCPPCVVVEWDITDGLGYIGSGAIKALPLSEGLCVYDRDPPDAITSAGAQLACSLTGESLLSRVQVTDGINHYANQTPFAGEGFTMPNVDGFPYDSGTLPAFRNDDVNTIVGTIRVYTVATEEECDELP